MTPAFDHGGLVWNAKGERGVRLDFSASVWPERGIAIPSGLRALLEPYPDPECRTLHRAAGEFYRIPEDHLLAVNGSTQGLDLLFRALCPRRPAVFTPSFSEYENAARRAALPGSVEIARLSSFRENNFLPELATPEADIVVLGNPNNPTGTLLSRDQLLPWLDANQRAGVWTVVDEAFMEFVPDPGRFSLLGELPHRPHLIVLRSMTKRFGLAGIRLGFVVATPAVLDRLRQIQPPWSVNTLAQQVGVFLSRRPASPNFFKHLDGDRDYLARGFRSLGFHVFPAAANFLLLQTPDRRPNTPWLAALRRRSIALRDASTFAGLDDTYLRCAVRPRGELRQLLHALQAIARIRPGAFS